MVGLRAAVIRVPSLPEIQISTRRRATTPGPQSTADTKLPKEEQGTLTQLRSIKLWQLNVYACVSKELHIHSFKATTDRNADTKI